MLSPTRWEPLNRLSARRPANHRPGTIEMLKSSLLSFLARRGGSRPPSGTENVAEPSPAPDSRRHRRIETSFAAVLHAAVENGPASVANLSPAGAMLKTELAPEAGEMVHLVRGGLCAQGTVVWSSASCCGVEFAAEICVDDWLAPAANGGQARIDEMVAMM